MMTALEIATWPDNHVQAAASGALTPHLSCPSPRLRARVHGPAPVARPRRRAAARIALVPRADAAVAPAFACGA